MPIYNSKLLHKKQVAEGTMEFILEKPKDLKYRAGQFFDIILEKSAPDAEKSSYQHGFSFVSAPYEDHLAAATRMRNSAFKRAIAALPENSAIKLDAVWGSFTLPKDESIPVVFLIGGIGVTPVRSMVAQATHDKTHHKMTLIYANRAPANAAFTEEFKQFAAKNANFTFVPVYDTKSNDPGAEHGMVDAAMVRRHVPDLTKPRFYLSGPQGMVRAMRTLLTEMGVDEDNIRTEEFDGY